MRVPPHMLADLSRATFSNIEHQAIEFVTHTINPIIKKIEQEFNKKLIFQGNKVNTYFEHNVNALLRGDAKSRAEYYKSLYNVGAISPNEIRRKENMNDIRKEMKMLIDQQHSVLVDVIQYLDQISHSDTHIRHKVDVVLNHFTHVNEKSTEEIEEVEGGKDEDR